MIDSHSFLADLAHLTCPIPKYAYKGKDQFLKDFQHQITTQSGCEWVILTQVTKDIFDTDFLPAEEYPFSSISSYNSHLEVLLLKIIASSTHAAAAAEFGILLDRATSKNEHNLRIYGGCHSAEDGTMVKVPDRLWRPVRLPRDRSLNWPTIVLEVSCSDTREKLMSDIRFWLGASGGEVKIVLTIAIEQRVPEIVIEQWVMKNSQAYQEQRVEITKPGDEIKVSGNLELAFKRVFLYSPSTDEAVISVHAPALKDFAEAVWEMQGFLDVERF